MSSKFIPNLLRTTGITEPTSPLFGQTVPKNFTKEVVGGTSVINWRISPETVTEIERIEQGQRAARARFFSTQYFLGSC